MARGTDRIVGPVQEFKADPAGLSALAELQWVDYGHQAPRLAYATPSLPLGDAAGLKMFDIGSVFEDTSSVLIGCGVPNVAVSVHDDEHPTKPGWARFNGLMFYRGNSYVSRGHSDLQAGVYFELQHVSPQVRRRLLDAMEANAGARSRSCAHINAAILDAAGFRLGDGRRLTRLNRPTRFVRNVWRNGLTLDGEPVDMRIVRTSDLAIDDHLRAAWDREATALARTVRKLYDRGHRRLVREPAPAMQLPVQRRDWSGPRVSIRVSQPSRLGTMLGFIWGRHPEYRVDLPRVQGDWSTLHGRMDAFAHSSGAVAKLKQHVLFRPSVVRIANRVRTRGWARIDGVPLDAALEMMNPVRSNGDGAPVRPQDAVLWNLVVVHPGRDQGYQLRLTPLKNRDVRSQGSKIRRVTDWVLAKHAMVSNYDAGTVWASQGWVSRGPDGGIRTHYDANSGTYQPDLQRAGALSQYLGALGVPTTFHGLDGAPLDLGAEAPDRGSATGNSPASGPDRKTPVVDRSATAGARSIPSASAAPAARAESLDGDALAEGTSSAAVTDDGAATATAREAVDLDGAAAMPSVRSRRVQRPVGLTPPASQRRGGTSPGDAVDRTDDGVTAPGSGSMGAQPTGRERPTDAKGDGPDGRSARQRRGPRRGPTPGGGLR